MTYPGNAGRSGGPGSGAGAGSIETHPLAEGVIPTGSAPGGSGPREHATRAAGPTRLDGGDAGGRRWCLGQHGDGGRADEHAVAHGAVEVALALDTAIVLTAVVLQLDADPVASREQGLADEADDASATIAQPDGLAGRELRHCVQMEDGPGMFGG